MNLTKEYRTRHEFHTRSHPKGKNFIIGLDAGYSSIKVFYENGYFCYPSFAKKMDADTLNLPDDNDILYKDSETGEIYMIGRTAQEMVSSMSTNDTEGELFSRKRYGNKKFRILCQSAIGLAVMEKKDSREILIMTGLPSSYVSGDTAQLKKALSVPARFSLKKGKGEWQDIEFTIKPEAVTVKPQPCGSMYSVLIRTNGTFIPEAKQILSSNILVLDIGFGTCDFYGVKSRMIVCQDSIDEIGMRKVMEETSKKIMSEYGEDIRIQVLQNLLEKGTVVCVDDENMTQEEKPIKELLFTASDKIFIQAMEQVRSVTNALRDYRYLVVTGGTGEAWYGKIKEYLSNMKSLEIIPGNRNDTIPFLFANVRGYYLYGYLTEGRERKV